MSLDSHNIEENRSNPYSHAAYFLLGGPDGKQN